jgi:phospholipid-binding lipoprotein MlaA
MKALRNILAIVAVGAGLAGCASSKTDVADGVNDPWEGLNRRTHALNVAIDEVALKPASEIYDSVTPDYGKYILTNVFNTLKLPRVFLNKALQGDVDGTLTALMRFGMNTAFGAGGLLDPATEMGLKFEDTDFGTTMAKYGVEEGPYVSLPLLGPSTVRDTVGLAVDLVTSPLLYIEGVGGTEINYGARAVQIVKFRSDNSAAIDQALYESEDSYVTTRAAYLQHRRREVAGEATEESLPSVFDN